MDNSSGAPYGFLKGRMTLALVFALIALSMAIWGLSDLLFVKDQRNCFINNGRLYCVKILWDDMTIREEELPSEVWASHTGK
jgi:hypothetical protein